MKLISVVTPCFNEQENVTEIYKQVKNIFSELKNYSYEHVFIDNASTDETVSILKAIANNDKNIKIIVNSRNFGHVRSGFYGLLQGKGDAVIFLVCDLQDNPSLIKEFIKKWEEGYKIVVGVKKGSKEFAFMYWIRKLYYGLIKNLSSEVKLKKNFTGFGLYDKRVIQILKDLDDPYPYLRGLVCEIGFETAQIEYLQAARKKGFSKNNFLSLYDLAMLGITNYSKLPLRLATMLGFLSSALSLLAAITYFTYKIIFWDSFSVGIAPLIIGLFLFSSVQLFFLGIVGEYIGSIYTQVLKRPLVVEKERINFSNPETEGYQQEK